MIGHGVFMAFAIGAMMAIGVRLMEPKPEVIEVNTVKIETFTVENPKREWRFE